MPAATAGCSLATVAADEPRSPAAVAADAERIGDGEHGADGGTAVAAAVAAPAGTTWLPSAKARAALAAGAASAAADHTPWVTGATNIARTFSARAQVIPAELLPVRAAEGKGAPVCGAMDAFVNRAHGTADAAAGDTDCRARVQERRGGAVRVKVCLVCPGAVLVLPGDPGERWDDRLRAMSSGCVFHGRAHVRGMGPWLVQHAHHLTPFPSRGQGRVHSGYLNFAPLLLCCRPPLASVVPTCKGTFLVLVSPSAHCLARRGCAGSQEGSQHG